VAEPRFPEKFVGEKIIIRKIVADTLITTYIHETSYCNTLLYVLKIKSDNNLNYRCLLGVLNSKLIGWHFKKKFQISDEDTFPQIMIRDVSQFPIPKVDVARHVAWSPWCKPCSTCTNSSLPPRPITSATFSSARSRPPIGR
jgi:hypothetical protein